MNNRGFTIPELLIASAMTLIAVSGIVTFSSVWKRNYDKSYATYMAVALESALLSAMVDPETYTPAVINQLAAGGAPPRITLNLTGLDNTSGGKLTITTNSRPMFVGQNLEACSGFQEASCLVQIEVRTGRDPAGNYAFAYDVQLNPKLHTPSHSTLKRTNQPALPGNTSPTLATPWDNRASYTVAIPNVLYKKSDVAVCGANTVGIRGVNRDTGSVECIKQTEAGSACPVGTFPQGVRIINDATSEIGFKCSQPATVPTCKDKNYSLSRFSPVQAKLGLAARNIAACKPTTIDTATNYPGQDPIIFGQRGATSIVGTVCPPNYKSTSSCRTVVLTNTPGTCWSTVAVLDANDDPVLDANGNPTFQDVKTNPEPNKGISTLSIIGNNDRDVSCIYTPPVLPQPCTGGDPRNIPAAFEGYPELTVTCKLDMPGTGVAQ
ncbi:MAG: hypothetical protein KDD38_10240 [Bdellovibrionales bacterium]|nr:hypothetical protein [Bdellovibrionales bacterium]